MRAIILQSQRELSRERSELPGELAEAKCEAERARSGELRREHMRDLEDRRRGLAEVDSEADQLRANGEDAEKLEARIRKDLQEAQAIDISREEREAIEEGDPVRIVARLRAEEQQMG